MRRLKRALLLPIFGFVFAALTSRISLAQAVVTPCTLQDGKQNCNESSLQHAVTAAKAIAAESGPRDRVAESQLRSLVTKLGKSLALDSQSADLTIRVTAIDQAGINYGAMDRELARLQVYAPADPARRLQLIWDETLSGPANLSWPAAVARLLDQFRRRVNAR